MDVQAINALIGALDTIRSRLLDVGLLELVEHAKDDTVGAKIATLLVRVEALLDRARVAALASKGPIPTGTKARLEEIESLEDVVEWADTQIPKTSDDGSVRGRPWRLRDEGGLGTHWSNLSKAFRGFCEAVAREAGNTVAKDEVTS